ncbi:MAG: response regulator [Myxococcaceae bacterium]
MLSDLPDTGPVSGAFSVVERVFERAPRTVVVAADDDQLRERLRDELSRDGYRVIEAEEGAEVLDYYALNGVNGHRFPAPDLVVAEVRMSGIDGVTLLGHLRGKGVTTPFILLAPKNDPAAYELADTLDAEFVFEEPVSCDELCEAVASLVG